MATHRAATPDADGPRATEETALLSGPGPGSGDPSRSPSAPAPRRFPPSADAANHPVSLAQGLVIGSCLLLLNLLLASNMSGMTMIQGPLAEALRAHDRAMWFTTSYLIAISSLTPLTGRLAAVFSPRAVVLPSALLFALGSLVAGQARSFAAFILGRVLAGCGGAGGMALAVIFVLELTGKRNRGVFIGLVNATFTMGVSFGAAVYGVLLPVVGWRPLFWGQAPLVLIAGAGIYLSIPESMASRDGAFGKTAGSLRQKLAKLDYLGAALLTLAIVLFLYGLAGDIHPLPILLSLLSLAAFVSAEYRLAADPIIPLSVLSDPGILLSCLAQLGLLSARWTVLFYAPVFMLAVHAAAPAAAGSILIPAAVGLSAGGLLVGWLHIRRAGSFYLSSLLSVLAVAATLCALALAGRPGAAPASFVAAVCLNSIATGIMFNYSLVQLLHLSRPGTEYITTSLLATFRGFGGSFGTSLGGGIFYRLLRSSLARGFLALDGAPHRLTPARQRLVARLLGSPELVWHGGDLLAPEERAVAVQGYAGAMRGVWQAGAALALFMTVVQAAAGWTAPKPNHHHGDEPRPILPEPHESA